MCVLAARIPFSHRSLFTTQRHATPVIGAHRTPTDRRPTVVITMISIDVRIVFVLAICTISATCCLPMTARVAIFVIADCFVGNRVSRMRAVESTCAFVSYPQFRSMFVLHAR